jgi:hypothetical protein
LKSTMLPGQLSWHRLGCRHDALDSSDNSPGPRPVSVRTCRVLVLRLRKEPQARGRDRSAPGPRPDGKALIQCGFSCARFHRPAAACRNLAADLVSSERNKPC